MDLFDVDGNPVTLDELELDLTVDGKTEAKTIKDLRAGWQKTLSAEQRMAQAAAERQRIEEESAAHKQALAIGRQMLAAQNGDWDAFRGAAKSLNLDESHLDQMMTQLGVGGGNPPTNPPQSNGEGTVDKNTVLQALGLDPQTLQDVVNYTRAIRQKGLDPAKVGDAVAQGTVNQTNDALGAKLREVIASHPQLKAFKDEEKLIALVEEARDTLKGNFQPGQKLHPSDLTTAVNRSVDRLTRLGVNFEVDTSEPKVDPAEIYVGLGPDGHEQAGGYLPKAPEKRPDINSDDYEKHIMARLVDDFGEAKLKEQTS